MLHFHTTEAPGSRGLGPALHTSPSSADPVGQGPPLMDHPGPPAADKRGLLEAPLPAGAGQQLCSHPRTCDHLLQDRLHNFHSEMAFVFTLMVSYLEASFEIVPTCD